MSVPDVLQGISSGGTPQGVEEHPQQTVTFPDDFWHQV
jgi:hypothetical protein